MRGVTVILPCWAAEPPDVDVKCVEEKAEQHLSASTGDVALVP